MSGRPIKDRIGGVLAGLVADRLGSWTFIFWLTAFFAAWGLWNTLSPWPFDPYPCQFLNLVEGTFSTYAMPILLIAGNLQSAQQARQIEELKRLIMKRGSPQ